MSQVLALWGEVDPWTPLYTGLHSGVSLAQYLDSFELVVLPDTGHCPHDENPEGCHAGVCFIAAAVFACFLVKLERVRL